MHKPYDSRPATSSLSSLGETDMNVTRRFALLALLLVLLFAACNPAPSTTTPPDFDLSLSPETVTLSEGVGGEVTISVGISRTNFEGDISLSFSGAGVSGSFSPASTAGTSSSLSVSVPASLSAGAYTFTVSGAAGDLERSASLTLIVEAPPSTDVTGKVMNLAGEGLSGINVQIVDQDGPKALVVTGAGGSFSVSDVKTPYSVSAVPPPPLATELLPITWDEVSRSDPQVVLPGISASPVCSRAPATLSGSVAPAVGAGNTATVSFVAEGLSIAPIMSSASDNLVAGDGAYSISVPFDEILCETTVAGKLIYLERDGGNIVKSAVYEVSVTTGNASTQDLSPASATTSTLSGEVGFPSGVASGTVYAMIKVGGAYQLLNSDSVTPASPGYTLVVPDLGLPFRTLAVAGGGLTQWAYSEELAAGAVADLTLPNLNTAVDPSGSVSETTPSFSQTPVSGANLYFSLATGGASTGWVGASAEPEVALPALPNPARLVSGGSYNWYALNALHVRGASSADDLLDGRLVKEPFFYNLAVYNPDLIAFGTLNMTPTAFSIP